MADSASITISASHPKFAQVLRLVADDPDTKAAASPVGVQSTLSANSPTPDGQSESELRRVLTHLGQASTAYLRAIAEHLRKTGGSQFILADLLPLTSYSDLKSIRACNRNTSRAIKDEGVELWAKKWDRANSCQTFTVSPAMREALLEVFASK